MNPNPILTLVALWPFAGFGISLLLPAQSERLIARWAQATLAISAFSLATLTGIWLYHGAQSLQLREVTLYQQGDYGFFVEVYFDFTAAVFLWTGALIAGMVVYYSGFYMHREWGYKRFFNTLLFFYAAYASVILSGNFETLFMGWEFIGLSSFLLVAFYRLRYMPVRNAVKVYTIYRLGDVGLLMAMWMSHHFWHANISFAELERHGWSDVYFEHHHHTALFVSLMVLLAAMAKSAQFPFSSWLPRAMEGPTPSSAVFYGSLSVHLGVYLLLRTHAFWEMLPEVKGIIAGVGLLTALICSLIARVQPTIKGQIAYSSSAQIGLMFMEVAAGFHHLALLHFVGNALLRTYQLLVSPSLVTYRIRDQFYHHQPRPEAPPTGSWRHRLNSSLYLLSLKEWNLDALVFAFILSPLKRIRRILRPIPDSLLLATSLVVMGLSSYWSMAGSPILAGTPIGTLPATLSTLLGMWALLLLVKVYNERGSLLLGWTWALLGNLMLFQSTSWHTRIDPTEVLLFVGGILFSSAAGYVLLFTLRRANGGMPHLNAYQGLIHTNPTIGFLYLLCCLGMSGFPITTTFIGQDVLLSHVGEGDVLMAGILAFSFVINGISLIRMYARVFLGHHRKSLFHPTPHTL
jgi:NADH:ubiquinone oxidoreductase subunit 5 (subunit L)/multisubunit Na+/H+ antiporter MnhA subunit